MSDLSPLMQPYRALVIGATGAIGGAFVEAFQADALCQSVACVSRTHTPGFDLRDASGIEQVALALSGDAPYDVIIDATGQLTIDGIGPEKSLAALNDAALLRQFQINTVGPAMTLRYFAPLLCKGPAIYGKLSARVGSISDNQKGGWYGYRASKAAFNMVLQSAAIELQRRNPALRVVALQPGTVRSPLSNPFSQGVSQLLEPEASVAGMLGALRSLPPAGGAQFIDHRGESIGW
jgi:NAD(P)-dependent dehydrogenase (short-subunit alcohol dehydrogenase family)